MDATNFIRVCRQTIVWEQKTGRDPNGLPTYAAPVTFAPPTGGRRAFKVIRRSNGLGGVQFIQGSWIWLMATPDIGLEDRLYVQGDTVVDGAGNFIGPPILDFEKFPNAAGQYFYVKCIMGSAKG